MPAKFNLLVAASIPAVAIVPLLACGGSSAKTDSGIVVHDSPGSNGSNGSGSACTFAANLTPTVTASATKYAAGSAGFIWNENSFRGLIGGTQGSSDQKEIRVLIFGGCGTTGTGCPGGSGSNDATPDWPTTFTPKSNLDLSQASVQHDVLILLLGDPDTMQYNTIYVAAAGTVNITKAANGSGSAFAGNGSNLDFIHVDSQFQTAADGCESIVPSFSWSGATFTQKDLTGGPEIDPVLVNTLRHRTL